MSRPIHSGHCTEVFCLDRLGDVVGTKMLCGSHARQPQPIQRAENSKSSAVRVMWEDASRKSAHG
jgi:hypothetical protein